jgi:hypothetical protein
VEEHEIEEIIEDTMKTGELAALVALQRSQLALNYAKREIAEAELFLKHFHPHPATRMSLTVQGGHMSVVSIDTTTAVATVQFLDSHGNAVAGPADVTPVLSSDNEGVITVAPCNPGANVGEWTAALSPVAEGSANISVNPLTDVNGNPVNDAAGNPFPLPEAVNVTVTGGTAASLTLTVTV